MKNSQRADHFPPLPAAAYPEDDFHVTLSPPRALTAMAALCPGDLGSNLQASVWHQCRDVMFGGKGCSVTLRTLCVHGV